MAHPKPMHLFNRRGATKAHEYERIVPIPANGLVMSLDAVDLRKPFASGSGLDRTKYRPEILKSNSSSHPVYSDAKSGYREERDILDITGTVISDNHLLHNKSATISVTFPAHVMIEFPTLKLNKPPPHGYAVVNKIKDILKNMARMEISDKQILNRRLKAIHKFQIVPILFQYHRQHGFNPDLEQRQEKKLLYFPVYKLCVTGRKFKDMISEAIYKTPQAGMKLADIHHDPKLNFAIMTGVKMSGNIVISKAALKTTNSWFFHTDLEFQVVYDVVDVSRSKARNPTKAQEICGPIRAAVYSDIKLPSSSTEDLSADMITPKNILAWDIEMVHPDMRFPKGDDQNDELICIGCATKNTGTDVTECVVFCLDGVEKKVSNDMMTKLGLQDLPNVEIRSFPTSPDIVDAFRDYAVFEMDARWMIDYNGSTYDREVMMKMSNRGVPNSRANFWGTSIFERSRVTTNTVQTRAHGIQTSTRITASGRVCVDLLSDWIHKTQKLGSYKLDDVAEKLLGKNKVDMNKFELDDNASKYLKDRNKTKPNTYESMMARWYGGDPTQRFLVMGYCAVDALLLIQIWDKLILTTQTTQLARIGYTSHAEVFSRGKTWPNYCLLAVYGRNMGYVMNQELGYSKPPTWRLRNAMEEKDNAKTKELVNEADALSDQISAIRCRIADGKNNLTYGNEDKAADKILLGDLKIELVSMKTQLDNLGIDSERFQGATVLKAVSDFFDLVLTLDFSSLYPSIIEELNLCYSTIVTSDEYDKLDGWKYYEKTIRGKKIIFNQDIPGVLPSVVKYLNSERAVHKALMKKYKSEKNGPMYRYHKACSNAIKIVANSSFGAAGAPRKTAKYSAWQIPWMITARGREMIDMTINKAEQVLEDDAKDWKQVVYGGSPDTDIPEVKQEFTTSLGKVIYGDTDSIMISLEKAIFGGGEAGRRRAFAYGNRIGTEINKIFSDVHDLEFEKLSSPYLLIGCKRYKGFIWEYEWQLGNPGELDQKGVVSVRRDFTKVEKDLFNGMGDFLMKGNPDGAIDFLVKYLLRMLEGEFPLQSFVKSCLYKGRESYSTHLPQVAVDDGIVSRGGPRTPAGTRLSYCIRKGKSKKDKTADLACDLEFMETNDIPVDIYHYIKHGKNNIIAQMACFKQTERLEIIYDQALEAAAEQWGNEKRFGSRHVIDPFPQAWEKVRKDPNVILNNTRGTPSKSKAKIKEERKHRKEQHEQSKKKYRDGSEDCFFNFLGEDAAQERKKIKLQTKSSNSDRTSFFKALSKKKKRRQARDLADKNALEKRRAKSRQILMTKYMIQ